MVNYANALNPDELVFNGDTVVNPVDLTDEYNQSIDAVYQSPNI